MGDIHPAGIFDAVITDHGFGTSKKKGTPQLTVGFDTEAGHITGFFYLSPAAIEQTAEKVKAMGFKGSKWEDLQDGTALKGNKCVITVKHDTFEGRTLAKVEWVNEEGYQPGIQHDAAVASNLSMFDSLFGPTKADAPPVGKQQKLPV